MLLCSVELRGKARGDPAGGGLQPPLHKELLRLEAAWITLSLYTQCCYVHRHRKQSDAVRLSLVTLTMHHSSEDWSELHLAKVCAAFLGLGPEPYP